MDAAAAVRSDGGGENCPANPPETEHARGSQAQRLTRGQATAGHEGTSHAGDEENLATLRYLEGLPDDCPLPTAEPLGELLAWLTQLMREVEHLHGMLAQEPAPWLLLCRGSDLLNTDGSTGLPTGYDKVYVDLMQTYRNAARTAMSVADTAGRVASPHPQAVALSWRIALQLESALWIYRGQTPTRDYSSRSWRVNSNA